MHCVVWGVGVETKKKNMTNTQIHTHTQHITQIPSQDGAELLAEMYLSALPSTGPALFAHLACGANPTAIQVRLSLYIYIYICTCINICIYAFNVIYLYEYVYL